MMLLPEAITRKSVNIITFSKIEEYIDQKFTRKLQTDN